MQVDDVVVTELTSHAVPTWAAGRSATAALTALLRAGLSVWPRSWDARIMGAAGAWAHRGHRDVIGDRDAFFAAAAHASA